MEYMQYIITGFPRSGTGFMAKLFTQVGIPMTHEVLFGMPGLANWKSISNGEASWLAVPHLHKNNLKKATLIHILRNPIKAISSLYNMNFFFERGYREKAGRHYTLYATDFLPSLDHYEGLDKYIHFWIEWNKKIDAFYRFRLEDVVENPRNMFNQLGIMIPDELKFDTTPFNKTVGGEYEQVDLTKCKLYPDLRRTAVMYGYDLIT